MLAYDRLDINSKLICKYIKNRKIYKILIIGIINDDLKNLLIDNNIICETFEEVDEKKILDKISNLENKCFNLIILNCDLTKFYRIDLILSNMISKSNALMVRFFNNNSRNRIIKERRINKIIKFYGLNIASVFFANNDFFTKYAFLKKFSNYTVYVLKKNFIILNTIPILLKKIKLRVSKLYFL